MRLPRAVPLALVLIVLISLAGVTLNRMYADRLLGYLLLGAAVGSVSVSLATRRLASWLVAPVSVLALLGYAGFALWLTATRAQLPGDFGTVVVDAVRNGIPRLLTAMIPVEPVPDTVVVPLVAAWLAGLAAAEVALRAGRTLLGLTPPTLLFAGAVYVVGPNADAAIWPTVGFAAAAATALALTTGGRPAEGGGEPVTVGGGDPVRAGAAVARLRVRRVLTTVVGLAAVVGLTAALAPVVAGRVDGAPVDPRRYVQPPTVESLDENPLIRISGWALEPEQELFQIHTEGGTQPPTGELSATASPRVRLAVLTDYDGVTWRVGATYRNAGRILPTTPVRPGTATETVRQEIVITGLTGRLLPAVATPRQISGARVAYDQASGTLIRPDGLAPGLRYQVISEWERPDLNLLATANVPAGAPVARLLQVEPGVPESLQRLATELAADNGAPYSRALAIEQFLAEHYRLVADAPSGHAYPNLDFFLFGPRAGGGQRGTSEQFAAAFAVLGRLMGLPTRVVVGFQPPAGGGPVRGGDAYAWPEVLFEETGWVAFDPLPRPNTQPRPVEEDFRPKPEEPSPSPEEAVASSAPPTAGPEPLAEVPDDGTGPGAATLLGVTAVGASLLLAVLVGVVLVLRRRLSRRRLTTGTPAERVAGAWREVTDTLRLAGQPAGPHLAATEVARQASDRHTGPAVRQAVSIDELAELVNLAAFAPQETTPEQARRAAELASAYATAVRDGRPWWQRLLWSVHPGPLRWR